MRGNGVHERVLFYDPKGVTDGPLPRTLCAKSIAACLKLFTHTGRARPQGGVGWGRPIRTFRRYIPRASIRG